jgi:hypothetical protein
VVRIDTVLVLGAILLAGCVEEPDGRGRGDWTPSANVEEAMVASCVDACGDQAAGGCWCDDACDSYGDCCPDVGPVCRGEAAPSDDGTPAEDDGAAVDEVTVEALLDLTADCKRLPGTSLFRTDAGKTPTLEVCQLDGAIWWRADGDIDCDGGRSAPCTSDPWYQPETSSKDSTGKFIDSAKVPHFVVPLASNGFVPKDYGIKTGWNAKGSAGIIIYNGQMIYAPYADAGPKGVLGEMSAAAAAELGIPNHPVSGGVSSGVTYIVFTGDNYVYPIESASAAEVLGEELAKKLLADN